MFDDKILQIIPAPADMLAWYRDEQTGVDFPCRVVCLALMEDCTGGRYVQPMEITQGDGVVDVVGAASDFIGISFESREMPLRESDYE